MIAERSRRGGPADGRERGLAVPLDALRVRAVQRQPGEELGRHASAAARVVGRARLAGAAGLRAAQLGEQLGLPPHRGEAAGAADVAGQEVLVDGERAGVHVADRVDQADHPARAAQVQTRQRVAVGGQVEERVAGQHLLAAGHQPVVQLPLLARGGVQLVPHVRAAAGRPQPGQPQLRAEPVGDRLEVVQLAGVLPGHHHRDLEAPEPGLRPGSASPAARWRTSPARGPRR